MARIQRRSDGPRAPAGPTNQNKETLDDDDERHRAPCHRRTFGGGLDQFERAPLEQLELAANHRKAIEPDAIRRLAHMLATAGQLTPCIGHRVATDRLIMYAGQRRLLATRAGTSWPAPRSSRASLLSPA